MAISAENVGRSLSAVDVLTAVIRMREVVACAYLDIVKSAAHVSVCLAV
jgi:hypothetical protein